MAAPMCGSTDYFPHRITSRDWGDYDKVVQVHICYYPVLLEYVDYCVCHALHVANTCTRTKGHSDVEVDKPDHLMANKGQSKGHDLKVL